MAREKMTIEFMDKTEQSSLFDPTYTHNYDLGRCWCGSASAAALCCVAYRQPHLWAYDCFALEAYLACTGAEPMGALDRV